jgi:hypothetical protein
MLAWCSIAEMTISSPEARHHEVDGLRGLAHEDDLATGGGVEMALDAIARALVCLRGALAEKVHASVDVRVVASVVGRQRVDHRLGLLAGRGVVQVDQGLAVDLLMQCREVLADALDVPTSRDAHRGSLVVSPVPRRVSSVRSR